MNHFSKDSFENIISDLSNRKNSIDYCKNKYNHEKIEWTEIDELLAYYFRNNNKVNPHMMKNVDDLILQLKSDFGNFERVINISFSKTYFVRLIEIIIKIYYKHFTILQGDTGCGKTSVIGFLNDIVSLAKNDPNMRYDIRWNFYTIDFHGNYLQDDFDQEIKYISNELNLNIKETKENNDNEKIIIFLDNIDSSPANDFVIDHIHNSNSQYISYIATISENVEMNSVTQKLISVGIPQNIKSKISNFCLFQHPNKNIKELHEDYDANKYLYKVKKVRRSIESAIIKANPQDFDETTVEFLPNEEKDIIKSIIIKMLLQWKNKSNIDLPSAINIFSELIFMIFKSVRSFLKLRSIFSYRDVNRCISIFTYVFDYFQKHQSKEEKNKLIEKITSISIVISIYISFIIRFPYDEINTDEEILKRFDDHPYKDPTNPNPSKICMYRLILDYVSNENNWPTKDLPYINDWEHVSLLFAYAKCMKYIINEKEIIYPLPSLMLNLLVLSLSVSFSSKCLIIGMPGSSKTKSVEIFSKYKLNSSKSKLEKNDYLITTYLCSRKTDSKGLLSRFLDGVSFIKETGLRSKKAIVILENYGQVNYDPFNQSNIINHIYDKGVLIKKESNSSEYSKISFVQLSNNQVDFADMNRGFLVCDSLPTDDELYSSIAFGRIFKNEKDKKRFSMNISSNVLHEIIQLKDPIVNYEKLIDLLLNSIVKNVPKDFNNQKTFYKNVLKALWTVTQNTKQRPEFYLMRQLFNLIDKVTELKNIIDNLDDDEEEEEEEETDKFKILQKITFILYSFVQEENVKHDLLSPSKKHILYQFLLPLNLHKKCNIMSINSVTLMSSFISNKIDNRSILIRTENNEAFRYIDLLKEKKKQDNFIFNFSHSQDDKIMNILHHNFDKNKNSIFCFFGNNFDDIIELFNTVNQNSHCPIVSINGFPVLLPDFPKKIKFIFIVNDDELYNPALYSFIDGLDHLFLNKQILRDYYRYLPSNPICNSIKTKYLLDLPLTKKEEEVVQKDKNQSKQSYLLNYEKSNFQFLIDALQSNEGQKILNDHFRNTYIKSLNDLIEKMKSESNGGLPYSSAIVFTRTPFDNILDKFDDFIVIDNIQGIENVDKSKSIIIQHDISSIQQYDDNILSNMLSIVQNMQNLIMENMKDIDSKGDKLYYIIIFRIKENRIPREFGSTTMFPVVWIESLKDNDSSSVEEMYNNIYNGQLRDFYPIINTLHNYITEHFDPKRKQKIMELFSSKGVKLSNGVYNIRNIIETLSKQINENNEDKSQNVISIDSIKNEILNKINEIQNNYKEETDLKTRIKKNKALNEELDNFNLKNKYFSAISLYKGKIATSLIIILKICSELRFKSLKVKNIDNIIIKVYETIAKFSKISFIKEINQDTFSSPNYGKEIYPKHPELLFYNILKPFFEKDNYYNSLNKMKILISNLPPLEEMQLIDIFSYINGNYYRVKPVLPFNSKNNPEKVTIDSFNEFLNSRGLITKNRNISNVIDFMDENEDHLSPNLVANKINVSKIRNNIDENKWENIQYKQILLSDCNNNFIDKCNVNDYSHPYVIYNHFVNAGAFSIKNLNCPIHWIIKFFLYGSFNDDKHTEKDSNYINNIVEFIDSEFQNDPSNFEAKISISKEFDHFVYDYQFTEYCKKYPTEKIEKFDIVNHAKSDYTPLRQIFNKYPVLLNYINDDSIIEEVLKTDVTLNKRVVESPDYNPSRYDPSDFNPFSEKPIEIIKANFKEIREIEEIIQIFDKWKSKSLEMLSNENIFHNIRLKLFKDLDDLDDMFGFWFLNSEISLLIRQVYEICKAVFNDNKDKYRAEFKILKRIINPWNDDDRVALFFWEWFVTSVENNTFENIQRLTILLNRNPIKEILINCLPYYFCQYEDNDSETGTKIRKQCIISKRMEIKTFFIERFLYSNTIMPTITNKIEKGYIKQVFQFISHLPFVKHTKNLYILAGFINEIMKDFRDQINLLFLIINSFQNASDLLKVENFAALINDPKRTESPDLLAEAFKNVDEYNNGENAAEKMKSYINKLIEINNSTIFPPENKKKIDTIPFRLVAKENIHYNISLMNSFLPALAHLKFDINDKLFNILINAFKILTGNKEYKNLINEEPFYADVPTIFDFSNDFLAHNIYINIEKIDYEKDLFGFPSNDLSESLCNEIISFISNKSNISSYRVKIWKMIKNTKKPLEKPLFSSVLQTLIPLFEEFDESILNEHLFFKWPKNSMPTKLNGVEAASYFLRSYQINGKSLFDIIDDCLKDTIDDVLI